VLYRTTKVAAYCLEAHEQALVDNEEILTQHVSFYCNSTLINVGRISINKTIYDRRSYLKTWCCRCCFVDGDTIVNLTWKLDVVDVVLKVAAYCLEVHEQALVDNEEILTQQVSFYCNSTLINVGRISINKTTSTTSSFKVSSTDMIVNLTWKLDVVDVVLLMEIRS
jgi:hypothetical protein